MKIDRFAQLPYASRAVNAVIGGLALLGVLATGCRPATSEAQAPPDLTGRITSIQSAPAVPPPPVGDANQAVSSPTSQSRPTQAPANKQPSQGQPTTGTLLVEATNPTQSKIDKAAIRVTAATRIFEQRTSGRAPIDFAALRTGLIVQVWLGGPIAESYPVQATAREIVVLPSGSTGDTAAPVPTPPAGRRPASPSPAIGPSASSRDSVAAIAAKLGQRGLIVHRPRQAIPPLFGARVAEILEVDGRAIQLYRFANAAAASRARQQASDPAAHTVSWVAEPHLVQIDATLVTIVADDQAFASKVTAALLAP